MVQEDRGRVAALMEYSGQRSVDPSHHPMHRGEDRGEIRPRHLLSHPGTSRVWLLLQLPGEDWSIPKQSIPCPENDKVMEHALFVCPRFREEREMFRALLEGP